jgi:hypothetical protein
MPDLNDTDTLRGSIYAIHDSSTGSIVYVGLTDYKRDGDRFVEHVRDDQSYPWHMSLFADTAYQYEDFTQWPYYPSKLYDCKDFTWLEIAASEQYYWELHGGLTGALLNKQKPILKQTFLKYKNSGTWSGTVGFPPGWTPKV